MIEKNDIEKLVLNRKKSSLRNHFNDMFFMNNIRYSGEIREKEILLWYSSFWLRGAYPIFHLNFDSDKKLVGLKLEKNPFGKLLDKIALFLVLVFASIPIIISGLAKGWVGAVFVLFVAFILFLIMRKAAKTEKKIMTEELKDTVERIEREKFPEKFAGYGLKEKPIENEWTIKKIFTRIFMYPICVGFIYVCAALLIPNGQLGKGICGIAICGAYLYSDIYAILKSSRFKKESKNFKVQ
ncbi:hypothetical protein J4E06_06655 [Muricauda sp. NFXS6]|uniref:hypothetical protein n=1 Tax=Allomuricauda sp. NFXS6 TaxID=2819094 RepID=UPI0032DE3358